jgi:hypothetical protein
MTRATALVFLSLLVPFFFACGGGDEPVCGDKQETCACATGHYCVPIGFACHSADTACPAKETPGDAPLACAEAARLDQPPRAY